MGTPTNTIAKKKKRDAMRPVFAKSTVFTYGRPWASSCETAVMLGKPEMGRPMPAEVAKQAAKTMTRG